MEKHEEIKLKCLFCFSTSFELPEENYTPKSGEMIKCSNCGKLNNYDSMMRVVQKEGQEWAENQAKSMIDEFTKNMKKDFGK